MKLAIFSPREVRQMLAAFAIFALVLMTVQGMFVPTADARTAELPSGTLSANTQVDLCHNNNGASDYSLVQAKAGALVSGDTAQGHPDANPLHQDDIIPPFDYDFGDDGSGTFPGRHWNTDLGGYTGEELFLNDCIIPASDPVIDLAITKVADDDTPDEGQIVVYTIDVVNKGPDTATNVVVTDSVPAGTTFVSANPAEDSSGPLTWKVGSLASGASTQILVTVTVDPDTGGDVITNNASVSSDESAFDSDSTNDTVDEDVTVNTPSDPVCEDETANNTGDPLPCVYPEAKITLLKEFSYGDADEIYDATDFTFYVEGGEVTLGVATTTTPGTFTISESGPVSEFDLGIQCDGGSLSGADLTVVDTDDVTCTLTNTFRSEPVTTATLVVEKVITDGSNAAQSFDFSGSLGDFALLGGESTSSELTVADGPFSISESVPTGWTQESAVCVYGDQSTSNPESIDIAAGETVTCTFTNDEDDVIPVCEDPEAINFEEEGACEYPEPICEVGENLLLNGSFEEPVIVGDWSLVNSIDWVTTKVADGLATQLEIWNNFMGTASGFASDGEQNVELGGAEADQVTQTVTTIPGATYELRFDFSPRATYDASENSVDALVDGVVLMNAQADGSANTENVWTTHSQTFVAASSSTDITLADVGTDNGVGSLADNAVLCLVSEPEPEPVLACDLSVSANIVNSGASFDLIWDTTGADHVEINQGIGSNLDFDGSTSTSINNDTTFTLTAYSGFESSDVFEDSVTCEVPVSIRTSGGGGGGGGGSTSPVCSAFDLDGNTLSWETRYGTSLTITADGEELFTSNNDDTIDGDEITVAGIASEYELTVSRGSRSDTCTINPSGPTPQVLGEQVTAVPLGAANTGAGGAAPVAPTLPTLLAVLSAVGATRVIRNAQ